MASVIPTDISTLSDFLPIQYNNSTALKTLLSIYLDQVQELEIANIGLSTLSTDITTAFGYQLDIIGKFLGAYRVGRTDEDYRLHILITVAINRSNGSPEDILTLLDRLLSPTNIRYWEHYPASIYLYVDGVTEIDKVVLDTVRKLLPAGASLGYLGYGDNQLVFTPYDRELELVNLITNEAEEIEVDTGDILQVVTEVPTAIIENAYLSEYPPAGQPYGILAETL